VHERAAPGVAAAGAEVRTIFSGVRADALMSSPAVVVDAAVPVGDAVSDYFGRYSHTAFPVIGAQRRALGVLTIARVEALPAAQRTTTTVGEISHRDPTLIVGESAEVEELLERPSFARVGRAVVVDAAGVSVGVVSITDIQRAMRSDRCNRRRWRANSNAVDSSIARDASTW
jgi:predicted transcriptional regulator